MRIIGLDIHRAFAEAVALEDGELKRLGRIGMTRDHLKAFAKTLDARDHVVVEATGKCNGGDGDPRSACGQDRRGQPAAGASDRQGEDQN